MPVLLLRMIRQAGHCLRELKSRSGNAVALVLAAPTAEEKHERDALAIKHLAHLVAQITAADELS